MDGVSRPAESPANGTTPTVYIIDADAQFRSTLESTCNSVALRARSFEGPEAFLAEVTACSRGCVVLNAWMPGMTALHLQEALGRQRVLLPLIIVSSHPDIHTAVESLKRGAFDFLDKSSSPQLLLDRIFRAIKLDALRSAECDRIQAIRERLTLLSQRERQVLDLLVRGKTTKQAAAALGLSAKTVENHRARIMDKTGAEAFAVLVREVWEGARGGLLNLEQEWGATPTWDPEPELAGV